MTARTKWHHIQSCDTIVLNTLTLAVHCKFFSLMSAQARTISTKKFAFLIVTLWLSLTCILPYKDRIYDFVLIRENTGNWKPVFLHILCCTDFIKQKFTYCDHYHFNPLGNDSIGSQHYIWNIRWLLKEHCISTSSIILITSVGK